MSPNEVLALLMFLGFILSVFTGYPVAWLLGGLAILFTALAIIMEVDFHIPIGVDWAYTSITVDRIWGVMENWVMVALPMFIFMGLLLNKSGIAIFYLKGVAPPEIDVATIYRGVFPFILLQLAGLGIIFNWQEMVTWLPAQAYAQ